MSGIIYFVQPVEFVEKNLKQYKIGISEDVRFKRCRSYGIGTRMICIMETYDLIVVENKIKKFFKSKFKLCQGHEYFEGDEKIMAVDFFNIVMQHNNLYDHTTEVIKKGKKIKKIKKYDNDTLLKIIELVKKYKNKYNKNFKNIFNKHCVKYSMTNEYKNICKLILETVNCYEKKHNENTIDIDLVYICEIFDTDKNDLKKILKKNFKENIDFKIKKLTKADGALSNNFISIMISINCFKNLCLISNVRNAQIIKNNLSKIIDI